MIKQREDMLDNRNPKFNETENALAEIQRLIGVVERNIAPCSKNELSGLDDLFELEELTDRQQLIKTLEIWGEDEFEIHDLYPYVGAYDDQAEEIEGKDVWVLISRYTHTPLEDVLWIGISAYAKLIENGSLEETEVARKFKRSSKHIEIHSRNSAASIMNALKKLFRVACIKNRISVDFIIYHEELKEYDQTLCKATGLEYPEQYFNYKKLIPLDVGNIDEDHAIIAYSALTGIPLVQMAAGKKFDQFFKF